MVNPRPAKLSEFDDVINHINNIFRIRRGCLPTMQQEFPLLLNPNNIDNMIVIKEDGKIVSVVNFLIQEVLVEGISLKCAFIGAVCTDPAYEKRGYSSKILDYVEKQVYLKGVDALLISGNRTLYTRRKATKVKCFYKYTIKPKNINLNICIEDYNEKYLHEIIERYNQNSTRFYRTRENFKTLLESATIPWGNYSYRKIIIKKEGKFIGYIILRIISEKEKWGQIIELSIPNFYTYDLLSYIANKYSLQYITYYVHVKNYVDQLEKYDEKELDYLMGTIKIINFNNMMNKLSKYIAQYVDSNTLDKINFSEDKGIYKINYNNKEIIIDDLDKLNNLIFGVNQEKKHSLNNIFPINFIWPANLNFQ